MIFNMDEKPNQPIASLIQQYPPNPENREIMFPPQYQVASVGNMYENNVNRSPSQSASKWNKNGDPSRADVIPQNMNDIQAIIHARARPGYQYSLEQTRFQNRIKNASRRQNDLYKLQINQPKIIEKERYAKTLEQRELQSIGAHNEDLIQYWNGKRLPLGKVITQVEMNNEEARNQLKEMLEYQIREKEKIRQEEAQIRNIYQIRRLQKEDEQLQADRIQQQRIELQRQQDQRREIEQIEQQIAQEKERQKFIQNEIDQQVMQVENFPEGQRQAQDYLPRDQVQVLTIGGQVPAGLDSGRRNVAANRFESAKDNLVLNSQQHQRYGSTLDTLGHPQLNPQHQFLNRRFSAGNNQRSRLQNNYSQSLPSLPNNRLPPIQSAVPRERRQFEPLHDPMNIRVEDQLPVSYNYFSTPQNAQAPPLRNCFVAADNPAQLAAQNAYYSRAGAAGGNLVGSESLNQYMVQGRPPLPIPGMPRKGSGYFSGLAKNNIL